jgi:hypothetical protein
MRTLATTSMLVILLASSIHARVLDDFSQGPAILIAEDTPDTHEASGLDPAHTIGGVRDTTILGFVILGVGAGPPPQAIFFQGIISPTGYGEFVYGENSPLGADFTADGSREFRVTLSGTFRAAYLQNSELTVSWLTGSSPQTATRSFGDVITHEGTFSTGRIPFDAFGQLTNVSQISLRFNGVPSASGSPLFRVYQFVTAVPEPSAGVTAVLESLMAIYLQRRVHR